MTTIIIYVDGHQVKVEEEQVKIYDPFPDKEKEQKEDETTKKSRSNN